MTDNGLGIFERFFFELPVDDLKGEHIFALSLHIEGQWVTFEDPKLVEALWSLREHLPKMKVIPDCVAIGETVSDETARILALCGYEGVRGV